MGKAKKEKRDKRVVGLTTKKVEKLLKNFQEDENRSEAWIVHYALEKFLTEYYETLNSLKIKL